MTLLQTAMALSYSFRLNQVRAAPMGSARALLRSSSIQAVAEPTEALGNGGFKRIAIPCWSIALS